MCLQRTCMFIQRGYRDQYVLEVLQLVVEMPLKECRRANVIARE